MKNKSIWTKYTDEELAELEKVNGGYIDFLSDCKTERECTEQIIKDAEAAGYQNLDDVIRSGGSLAAGDKVYRVNMGKSVIMFNIGTDPLCHGMNILGAHIDSPRLDVKQNPLYEDSDLAYLDTHYYGGIKKYQYVTLPLAIHGVFVKKDGTKIKVAVGEDPSDPVFFVSDLLIHLAQEQMAKKADKVVEGDALDLIIGNRPASCDKAASDKADGADASGKADGDAACGKEESSKESVKAYALSILKEKYDIDEEDFISAELEIVPAGRAREAGFDRSMILSYGQDDRVCAYTSYQAMIKAESVKRTACCILVDKEEIGSVGATGMESRFFENTVAEVISLYRRGKMLAARGNSNGQFVASDQVNEDHTCSAGGDESLILRRCLAESTMLSSDVCSGYDPLYAVSFDKKNASYLGRGLVLCKFTGAYGKSGSNDANAEYIAHLRDIFGKENISFQTAELGRVDLGGGGTIAYILALYGMNVIDSGVAVLSMHSPWEATSKADVFEAYRGYQAFLKRAEKID